MFIGEDQSLSTKVLSRASGFNIEAYCAICMHSLDPVNRYKVLRFQSLRIALGSRHIILISKAWA